MDTRNFDFTEAEECLRSPLPVSFYPARLAGTHPTVIDALCSAGFSVQEAETLVKNAAILQSESVLADLDDSAVVFTCKLPDGRVELWQTRMDLRCDTREKARWCAKDIEAQLEDQKGSSWAVFECREDVSRTLH